MGSTNFGASTCTTTRAVQTSNFVASAFICLLVLKKCAKSAAVAAEAESNVAERLLPAAWPSDGGRTPGLGVSGGDAIKPPIPRAHCRKTGNETPNSCQVEAIARGRKAS